MKDKTMVRSYDEYRSSDGYLSSLGIIRSKMGRSRRVGDGKMASNSTLAAYKDHFTYTFILEGEVASIYFDRGRREIFFRGHNIAHMDLSSAQRNSLLMLPDVFAQDESVMDLLPEYMATLGAIFADK